MLADTDVEPVDNSGISADAKEAIAFAILANESLHGHSGNVPFATGASVRKILGKFVCP
jgi:anhydro-N-acetylmuramic acid kinase